MKSLSHVLLPPVYCENIAALPFGGFYESGDVAWIAQKNEVYIYNRADYSRDYTFSFPPSEGGETEVQCCTLTTVGRDRSMVLIVGLSTKSVHFIQLSDTFFRTEVILPPENGSPVSFCICEVKSRKDEDDLCRRLLAIGTAYGQVYLMDLDNALLLRTNSIIATTSKVTDVSVLFSSREFLVIDITANTPKEFYPVEVSQNKSAIRPTCSITALHYNPEADIIIIGYEFGAFQLRSIRKKSFFYASHTPQIQTPVTHINSDFFRETSSLREKTLYFWFSCGSRDMPIISKMKDTHPYPLSVHIWSGIYQSLDNGIEVNRIKFKEMKTNGRMIFQSVVKYPAKIETQHYILFIWEEIIGTTKEQRQSYFKKRVNQPSETYTGLHAELLDFDVLVEHSLALDKKVVKTPPIAFTVDLLSVQQMFLSKLLPDPSIMFEEPNSSLSFDATMLTLTECVNYEVRGKQASLLQSLYQAGPRTFIEYERSHLELSEVGLLSGIAPPRSKPSLENIFSVCLFYEY
jgi:hypothetical protein